MALPAARHLTLAGAPRAERWAWGRATRATSVIVRPRSADEVAEAFAAARAGGLAVGLRGGGQSYGDAALCGGGVSLETSGLDRIVAIDEAAGLAHVEAGVTYGQLSQATLPRGLWPAVVPGTMHATLGGAAAMNVHGKNHFRVGALGEQLAALDVVLPSGERRRVTRDQHADLFQAMVGGFGMLGCIVGLSVRLQRVASGWLRVEPEPVGSFDELIAAFERRRPRADYLVGWVDGFARGRAAGRGLVHQGNHLPAEAEAQGPRGLDPGTQRLSTTILGVVPARWAWWLARPLVHAPGVRLVNAVKYGLGRVTGRRVHRQTHVEFAFLLNRMPQWERAYGPHGLVQYQSFVPAAHAAGVFREQIERAHAAGVPPFMGIFKRHRADDFLMSYAVDGFSLGLDFQVTPARWPRLRRLAAEYDRLVLAAGGRFYFAKDSTLTRESYAPCRSEPRVQRFVALKRALDPDNLLQTDLSRRVFGDFR
jgi:decaprenylphospho-beta-D-ribofuranose 2-oxidase